MSYILITPAKNEGENLPMMVKSILNQTILPKLWVIVDDGSTDRTPKIIKKLENSYSWIHHITLEKGHRDLGKHYAAVVKEGFEYAQVISRENMIEYEYVGKADADIILSNDYFEKLIEKLQEDPLLGIVSGIPYVVKSIDHALNGDGREDNILYSLKYLPDELPDLRLYREKTLEEIGGVPVTYSPDTVMEVKARLRGWKMKWFREICFYPIRIGGIAEGVWKGYKLKGYAKYYLGYSVLLVILAAIFESKRKPYYQGIALLYGYCLNAFRRREKIDDREVRDYFKHRGLKEVLSKSIKLWN